MPKKLPIPPDGVTPIAPTPYILPQEWENPTVKAREVPEVQYPVSQEEAAIPYVPAVVPDMATHVYVPVDPEPAAPPPEPEPAIPVVAPPFVLPPIPPHPNSR